jgi:hypothetical protein
MAAEINKQAMLDVLGRPDEVMGELERFSEDTRLLSTRQAALIRTALACRAGVSLSGSSTGPSGR